MDELDPALLTETLHRVLRQRTRHGLNPDRDGWFAIEEVCHAASAELDTAVAVETLRVVSRRARRLEIRGARIRVHRRTRPPSGPDILFHATTRTAVDEAKARGEIALAGGRRVLLSQSEDQAWRAAHRLDGHPSVVVVDAGRARRAGVRFQRARQQGLYATPKVPIRFALSLRDAYDEQWSAGGLPVVRTPDGTLKVALIQVTRRSGTTWEVAKGKLEPGESPEQAAVREVQEEMGVGVSFRLLRHVGDVRYGFLAPGNRPRLKTIFLYLMEPLGEMADFTPAEAEGVGEVRWFTPDEAVKAVTHPSLQPVMARARDLLGRYGLTPSASVG